MILKLIKYGYTYMIKDRDLNEFQNHIAFVNGEAYSGYSIACIKNSEPFFLTVLLFFL